jgi:hypothetical protein
MPQHKSFIPTPALIRNVGCLIKLLVGLTVVLCMGYFALVALNPKAREWALQGTRTGPGGAPATGKGPTPFKALNQILAIPAQAMGKTDDVVKANNARVGQLDKLVTEEEKNTKGTGSGRSFAPVTDPFAAKPAPSAKTGAAAPESTESAANTVSREALLALAEKRGATIAPTDPQTPNPNLSPKASATGEPQTPIPPVVPDSPDQMKLAGDIVIEQASPAGAPRASRAFFFAIVSLNVSGITQSKPARLLINNRLTYEGDQVNRPLGITFIQLDSANKLLVFKDATGATVTRSY